MLENLAWSDFSTLSSLPWPQVLLGLAAALAVLVIYDVTYVWPIHRRITALTDRCSLLERTLGGMVKELGARIEAAERRGRDETARVGERLGQLELAIETRSYEQAIGCAQKGEESSRLISCFGLTEGEADLVMLLHGESSRRAAVDKFARQLIDSAQH
jgi:hypothetical protein